MRGSIKILVNIKKYRILVCLINFGGCEDPNRQDHFKTAMTSPQLVSSSSHIEGLPIIDRHKLELQKTYTYLSFETLLKGIDIKKISEERIANGGLEFLWPVLNQDERNLKEVLILIKKDLERLIPIYEKKINKLLKKNMTWMEFSEKTYVDGYGHSSNNTYNDHLIALVSKNVELNDFIYHSILASFLDEVRWAKVESIEKSIDYDQAVKNAIRLRTETLVNQFTKDVLEK